MNYLLDTHTFLWFINKDAALSTSAKTLIENEDNGIDLSTASLWEMAIKISLGKLAKPSPFLEFVIRQLRENAITLLEIKVEHKGLVATMPFHHRDPFDRMIIAQALDEKLSIISRDEIFDSYGVQRHWR